MSDLLDIIKKFNQLKVLVVGDVMLDEYIMGEVNRISREAPIPVIDVKEVISSPGGGANAARNVKALGAKVALVGVVGPDREGRRLKASLGKEGLGVEGIVIDNKRRTSLQTRVMARNQQTARISFEDKHPLDLVTEEKVFGLVKRYLQGFDALIISDYGRGVATPDLCSKIIRLARENKVLCLVDPRGRDYSKYQGCNIVTPNEEELALALNLPREEVREGERFLAAGNKLLSQVGCDNLLVTRGGKGMAIFDRRGDVIRHEAVNKNGESVKDITGAGDTAIVTLALSLAAEADLKQAIALTSHACGVVVKKVRTAVVSPEELSQSLLAL